MTHLADPPDTVWIGSGLAVLSAIILFVLVPEVHTDHMTNEVGLEVPPWFVQLTNLRLRQDAAFRVYLEENGFDT